MIKNSAEELVQDMKRAAMLYGICIGKQGESSALATFKARYAFIQQVSEETATEIYNLTILKGINPDDIIDIAGMGYTHEDIKSIINNSTSTAMIHTIMHFRIHPRK